MTIVLDDLPQLQRQVEELRRDRDRAEGAVRELRRRLKKEFGASSLKEAEALLKKLQAEELRWYERYVRFKKAFERQWAERLADGAAGRVPARAKIAAGRKAKAEEGAEAPQGL